MRSAALLFFLVLLLALPAAAGEPPQGQIYGDYAEVRTADVYTGPCFANGEVGLTGNEAVLAWRVQKGTWNDVALDGLSVLAVVRANATLGDPYADPLPARVVLIVDERATPAQRTALIDFARRQNRALLNNVVAVKSAPIEFEHLRHGYTTVKAGSFAVISTRPLHESDQICRNEEVFYQPLVAHLSHAMPAMATDSGYQGKDLDVTWREFNRRGSFVGTFSY
jgi:hypothetical protein